MIQRSSVPARLTQNFFSDYKTVMKHYSIEEQIELTKYLLNVFSIYLEEKETDATKLKWIKEEFESLKKRYGKNFKAYHTGQLHQYFHFDIILAEKEIYTTEEFNTLKEQSLTKDERKTFIAICHNGLQQNLDVCYLECEPEKSEIPMDGNSTRNKKKSKLKREANDKKTCLSQDQTALLIHYLKQERVLLNDEYLNHTDAGKAFEILTGYSQQTLRQNLGKSKDYQNKTNLKEIDNLLTRLRIAIDKDLKGK